MKTTLKLIILFSALFCQNYTMAQTAEQLIKEHLDAKGGDNLHSIHSVKFIGKIETSGQEYKMLYIKQLPDKIRFQIDMNSAMGVTVFNGTTGWIYDPTQGQHIPTELTPQEISQKKPLIEYLMVFFDDLLLNYKSRSMKVSYIGKETIKKQNVHKLLVMLNDGTAVTYFIDDKTKLDYHHKVLFPDLNIIFDVELSNFADVEGIKVPLTVESKISDKSMTKITIETIKINPELNDQYFEMPK